MKNGAKEQLNKELSRLSKGFSALNIDYKKGVLKTAQGLLRIQRANKEATDGVGYSVDLFGNPSFGQCTNEKTFQRLLCQNYKRP